MWLMVVCGCWCWPLSQIVPLRPQRPSLRQEQGGGRDEARPLLHHRAHDQRGGVGRPDMARQLDQRHPGEIMWSPQNINSINSDNQIIVQDGRLSAQFEQTMVVTDTGVEVLTARPGKLHTPHFMESSWLLWKINQIWKAYKSPQSPSRDRFLIDYVVAIYISHLIKWILLCICSFHISFESKNSIRVTKIPEKSNWRLIW